jgi:transcriptional regulator with XRE-family HTH domain
MLDGELLRDRRIAAGLSIRAVADQTGIPAQTLRAFEARRQAADRQLTLASLERLTRLLDVDTGELFIRPARAATSDAAARSQFTEVGQGRDRDVVKLQAALLAHGGVLTRDDLADALGWDLQRLEHSLRALRNRLQPTGQRLRRAGWNSYALTAAPAALTARERQRLHGAASARQPLAPEAAAVLYEVTLGFRPPSWHHALLAAEPAALRQLRQRSLVRLIGRDRLEPTEAVLYSLDLSPNAREERP